MMGKYEEKKSSLHWRRVIKILLRLTEDLNIKSKCICKANKAIYSLISLCFLPDLISCCFLPHALCFWHCGQLAVPWTSTISHRPMKPLQLLFKNSFHSSCPPESLLWFYFLVLDLINYEHFKAYIVIVYLSIIFTDLWEQEDFIFECLASRVMFVSTEYSLHWLKAHIEFA